MFIHELFIPGKDYEVVGLDSRDCEEGDEYLTATFENYLSSSLCICILMKTTRTNTDVYENNHIQIIQEVAFNN